MTKQNQISCTHEKVVQTLVYAWPVSSVMEDCQRLTVKFCLCSQCPWDEGAITQSYITLPLRSSVQAVAVRLCISHFETRPPLIHFERETLSGEKERHALAFGLAMLQLCQKCGKTFG